jgi:hypothetical protein
MITAPTCKNCGHTCHCDTECTKCRNDVCIKCEHEKKITK